MPFHSLIDAVLKLARVKIDAYNKLIKSHFGIIDDFCASKPESTGQLKALLNMQLSNLIF